MAVHDLASNIIVIDISRPSKVLQRLLWAIAGSKIIAGLICSIFAIVALASPGVPPLVATMAFAVSGTVLLALTIATSMRSTRSDIILLAALATAIFCLAALAIVMLWRSPDALVLLAVLLGITSIPPIVGLISVSRLMSLTYAPYPMSIVQALAFKGATQTDGIFQKVVRAVINCTFFVLTLIIFTEIISNVAGASLCYALSAVEFVNCTVSTASRLSESTGVGTIIFIIALLGAVLCQRLFIRRIAPGALRRLKCDSRAPLLYLRTFRNDVLDLRRSYSVARFFLEFVLRWFPINRRSGFVRLEEIVGACTSDLGPLVGIGNPNEWLPELGAARIYTADDEWQARISEWMATARILVVLVGQGEGFQWEINQIHQRGFSPKVWWLFAPSGESVDAPSELNDALGLSAVDKASVRRLRLAMRLSDGQTVWIESQSRHEVDYLLALRFAASVSLKHDCATL